MDCGDVSIWLTLEPGFPLCAYLSVDFFSSESTDTEPAHMGPRAQRLCVCAERTERSAWIFSCAERSASHLLFAH